MLPFLFETFIAKAPLSGEFSKDHSDLLCTSDFFFTAMPSWFPSICIFAQYQSKDRYDNFFLADIFSCDNLHLIFVLSYSIVNHKSPLVIHFHAKNLVGYKLQ